MDTSVLKEPRGFMRVLQCLFAIVAFSTCCHYNTYTEYRVVCKKPNLSSFNVSHDIYYPFRLDHEQPKNVSCGGNDTRSYAMYPPGDLVSDAEYFVFIGVFSFLTSIGLLLLYVFCSQLYSGEQKRVPMVDFCFSLVVAIFWLAASSAWANAVITLKYVADPTTWIFASNYSICKQNDDKTFVDPNVSSCEAIHTGTFGEANASVIWGFLNVFLWASGLWFIYKETSWFANRAAGQQQSQQQEGPPHQQMP